MKREKNFDLGRFNNIEGCIIKPKSLVVLVDTTADACEYLGMLSFNSELHQLPLDQYSLVAVVPWELDVYFCHLGKIVQQRIDSILQQALKTAVVVADNNWNQSKLRTKNLYRVFRTTVRALKRYYQGCFLTERFRELLQGVMQNIAEFVKAYRRSMIKSITDQSASSFLN